MMFFHIHIPPEANESPASGKPEPELNRDGEPLYLLDPEGGLVINDPTLLISKEVTNEEPSDEDINLTMRMTAVGWVPLSSTPFWKHRAATAQ